jgi:EmrB/QacA subfamily drug resistance transporter
LATLAQPQATTAPAGRNRVLAGLMLTMALAAMDATIVATAIPSIVHDLGGFSLFAWVFSIYLLAQAVTIPAYGKLADLFGRKPILMVGTVVFLLGSVLSGVAWNMVALIAFRGVQGLGASAVQATTTTLAGDLYTLEERGRVQGWLASVWGIAAIIGPAIGGFFAEYATWRWIFYLNVPIGAAALLMIGRYLHEQIEPRHRRIDYAGAALLVAGTGLLILGLLTGGVNWGWRSGPSIAIFAGALVALAAFGWQETRAAEPLLPPWVFSRRLLVGANLSGVVLGGLTIGLSTFLPTYAQDVLGADAVGAGFVLAGETVGWTLTAAISARFYLRLGFRDTALVGIGACCASAALFVWLPVAAPAWVAALGCFIMGCGLGLLATATIVGLQSVVGWTRRGVVTGANIFARNIGQAVGAAVFGGIANVTLAGWLRAAPPSLQGQLPASINDASNLLHDGTRASAAALDYVRAGLALAIHHVFIGLAVVAVAGLVVLFATPRHFAYLHFPDDPEGTGLTTENTEGTEKVRI